LAEEGTAAAVVRHGGTPHLALAAPAYADARRVGVAYVRMPLERLSAGFDQARVSEHNYLALRQGSISVLERGDPALANGAEALAAKVPGSDLRIAAAVPDQAAGPLGLDAALSSIVAGVFALLALAAWLLPRRLGRGAGHDAADAGPTLAEQAALDMGAGAVPPPVSDASDQAPVIPNVQTTVDPARRPDAYNLDRGIFRAYDIRGIVGQSIDADVAALIGQAVGTVMQEQGLDDIVVGRDGRLSGPSLVEGLIAGLRRAGRNVVDVGMAPTPAIYFGAYHLRAGSCVAVTGSHNPPDYNGFKIVVGGETLSGDAIVDLYTRIHDGRLHEAAPGTLSQRDIGEDYVQRIAGDIQLERPLKVVVDAGNGVAGDLGPRVLAAIGAEVTPLFCEIDGTFPNHHPDPSEPHNLRDLTKMVQRLDADLGIAFDGDGDRLGVVTRDGENIFPDRLLMLFAADVLERNPGAQIIFDVKCTGRLPNFVLRHGGSPLMWKTGHSLIKSKMRETDAELAGEMSGHFFFKERWYGFDDGLYAAARLLEIVAARPQTPTETLAALPDGVSTPEIKVDAPAGDPHAFVERFRAAAKFEGARVSTIDGVRVDYPDGWGLVRASNTTPVLVMRFDADSREALTRIQETFRDQLLALQRDLVLPF
ncbi:phosphomannomutase/phosphoglucomutase, partial [Tolypothrix campylonemoides VB511288]